MKKFRDVYLLTAGLVYLITMNTISCFYSISNDHSTVPIKSGVLVMAHGGNAEWNAAVETAVTPLRSIFPIVVAFGMADHSSLQKAVTELEISGINRIAVVRLFLSAESFRHQTEYLLNIRSDPPDTFIGHSPLSNTDSQAEYGKNMHHENYTPSPILMKSQVILSEQGLLDSPISSQILIERVKTLSTLPKNESVLILAHGAGSDIENNHWISKMDVLTDKIQNIGPFRAVRVETLREDWNDKRKFAEQRIRDFVAQGNRDGGRVLVVPFRVFGFGPYREVLKDLTFVADSLGLLPHPKVTEWIKIQAIDCFTRAGWKTFKL